MTLVPPGPGTPERIIVFLPNRGYFGGTLVTFPLLLAIRRRWPTARILALSPCEPHRRLAQLGVVDEVAIYDKRRPATLLDGLRRCTAGRNRLVVVLRPGAEWLQLCAFAIPAGERWCFSQALGRLIDRRGIPYRSDCYKAFTYLALLGEPLPRDGDLLGDWLRGSPTRIPPRGLVLVPSGGIDDKLWPLARFAGLARWWSQTGKGPVCVVAGPREAAVSDWFAAEVAHLPAAHLLQGAALAEELQTFRQARMVVGNDCGPMHLAQLVDAPRAIAMLDWVPEAEWHRPGAASRCLRTVPGGGMASIGLDQVIQAVEGVLAAREPATLP